MKSAQDTHYRIATRTTMFGVFELWESKRHGDEVPADVWLNGAKVGTTWDDLDTWLSDNDYDYM